MRTYSPVSPVSYVPEYSMPPYVRRAYVQPLYIQPVFVAIAADAIGYSPYYVDTVGVLPYLPPSVPSVRQQVRAQLLELNREFAGWLGLDPRYTFSTNVASEIAARTTIPFRTAKRLFHGGVAGVAAAIISFFGAPLVASVGLAAIFYGWLESFDSSDCRQ